MEERLRAAVLRAMELETELIVLVLSFDIGNDELWAELRRKEAELEFWKIIWNA